MLLEQLSFYGTKSVIITGGEPLLRRGLHELARGIKQIGMRVTLSTNGTFKDRLAPIMPFVDDIGLPIDGHTHETNAVMRRGSINHFAKVLGTIKHVQETYPSTKLTVRTVISAKNKDSVPLIGGALKQFGIDPSRLRWKFYQISPEGTRHDETVNGGWMVSREVFDDVMNRVREQNPEFKDITCLPVEKSIKRYLLLDPAGNALVLGPDAQGFPTQILIGDLVADFDLVAEELQRSKYFPTDITHGV